MAGGQGSRTRRRERNGFPAGRGSSLRLTAAGGLGSLEIKVTWSSDKRRIFITLPIAAMKGSGRTYALPLPPGRAFPQIPQGGFQAEADIAKMPGARLIDAYDVAPGQTSEVYAFSRGTLQRNLYRIPLP